MEKVRCALCNGKQEKTILLAKDYRYELGDNTYKIVQCVNCGLIYVNPRPIDEDMAKFYPSEYHRNEGLQRVFKSIIQMADPKLKLLLFYKRNGKILDVGCGSGDLLFFFKERGFQTYGVDINQKGCRLAKERVGETIFNCELADCNFPPNTFDVVTLNHSFEHMRDPVDCLRKIHRILKDNGILFISVPNIECFQFKLWRAKYTGLDIPRHLYHYSPKTIKDMISNCGFNVIKTSM